eukprot:Polyplicarium_translucidae@DN1635_c0_g1_i1.p1
MSTKVLAASVVPDANCQLRKRAKLDHSQTDDSVELTGGTPREHSFLENVQALRQAFPEVSEGLISSVLESSQNDVDSARSLIADLYGPSAVNHVATRERKRAFGSDDAEMPTSQPDNNPPTSDHVGPGSPQWLSSWCLSIVSSLQHCGTVEDASQRLRPQLSRFLTESRLGASSVGDAEGGDNSHDGVEDPSESDSPCGTRDTRRECRYLRKKVIQFQSEQKVLCRGVRSLYEKLNALACSERQKSHQIQTLSAAVLSASSELKRAKEANRALQYYVAAANPVASDLASGGRPPPNVF